MIFGHLIRKTSKPIHRPVCTPPYAAGITFIYESAVEERVEFAVYRMVQESVAHRGFVDVTGFGVGYFKVLVTTVTVGLTY